MTAVAIAASSAREMVLAHEISVALNNQEATDRRCLPTAPKLDGKQHQCLPHNLTCTTKMFAILIMETPLL